MRNCTLSARFVLYNSPFPCCLLIPQHIPPSHPHILTYLSFSCTHRHILKTPHRTCDCSRTISYSDERICLSVWFSLFLSWIQIIKAWGKKKKRKARDLFHCISSGWILWHLTELFYLIKKGDKCKGEPWAVNFKTRLSTILIPHWATNVPFPLLWAFHQTAGKSDFYLQANMLDLYVDE